MPNYSFLYVIGIFTCLLFFKPRRFFFFVVSCSSLAYFGKELCRSGLYKKAKSLPVILVQNLFDASEMFGKRTEKKAINIFWHLVVILAQDLA